MGNNVLSCHINRLVTCMAVSHDTEFTKKKKNTKQSIEKTMQVHYEESS